MLKNNVSLVVYHGCETVKSHQIYKIFLTRKYSKDRKGQNTVKIKKFVMFPFMPHKSNDFRNSKKNSTSLQKTKCIYAWGIFLFSSLICDLYNWSFVTYEESKILTLVHRVRINYLTFSRVCHSTYTLKRYYKLSENRNYTF